MLDCPYCHTPIPGVPDVEMQGVVILCDSCLGVSIRDGNVNRPLTPEERDEFNAGPAFVLVEEVRRIRGQIN